MDEVVGSIPTSSTTELRALLRSSVDTFVATFVSPILELSSAF